MADGRVQLQRLTLLDGIRGLAALWVVAFHAFQGRLRDSLAAHLPLSSFVGRGFLGVPIFFSITGFVVIYILRDERLTLKDASRQFFRRLVRLTLPYWAALLLPLAYLIYVQVHNPARRGLVPPAWQIVAHMLYLQDLLRLNNFMPFSWTMCIDVQSYIVIIAMMLGAGWLQRRLPAGGASVALIACAGIAVPLMLLSFIASLLGWQIPGLFLTYWPCFALGSVCCWATTGQIPRWLLAAIGLAALAFVWKGRDVWVAASLSAVCFIYVAHRLKGLGAWINDPVSQYLARISYSLYLIHYELVHRVVNFGDSVAHSHGRWSILWFFLAIAVSIAAAHVFHVFVEMPCHHYARSLWHLKELPPPVVATESVPHAAQSIAVTTSIRAIESGVFGARILPPAEVE